MFDARLRPLKQRMLAPLVWRAVGSPPLALTAAGLLLGLAAALAAANSRWLLALLLFVANRLVDGLDGDVARARSEASDHGGYADIVVDTIVYAAVPLGAAAGSDIDHIWPIAAALVASFYVNSTTWMYLAAVIEKRGRVADTGLVRESATTTSVVMPAGLIEGAETIAFFVLMLAVPGWLDWTMGTMAVAVSAGAIARFVRGHQRLRAVSDAAQKISA